MKQARDLVLVAGSSVLLMAGAFSAEAKEQPRISPELKLETLTGEGIDFGDLRGKTVLLDFWATWCPPCRDSVSDLRRIDRRLADRPFVLISISVDRDRDLLDLFIADEEMTWHQVWDPQGTIARAFGVHTFPMFVVIDHEGLVRFAIDGWGPTHGGILTREVGRCLSKLKKAEKRALKAAAQ